MMQSSQFEQELLSNKSYMATIISGVVKRPEDVDDVLQETMLNAFRARKRFRGEAMFKTWLYKIAKNQALMWVRRQQAARCGVTESITDYLDSEHELFSKSADRPDRAYEYTELADRVWKLLEAAPSGRRKTALLYLFWEMAPMDIAKLLQMTNGAAKSSLHQARVYLRKELVV